MIDRSARTTQTVLEAVVANLLNPNPYLSCSLVLGPLLLEAWRADPAYGIGFLVSFVLRAGSLRAPAANLVSRGEPRVST